MELESNKYVLHPVTNWVNGFTSYLNLRTNFTGCPELPPAEDNITESQFYKILYEYTQVSVTSDCCLQTGVCGSQYSDHIQFEFDENNQAVGIKSL